MYTPYFQSSIQRKLGLPVMPLALHRYEATHPDSLRPEGNIFHSKLRSMIQQFTGMGWYLVNVLFAVFCLGQKGLKMPENLINEMTEI